MVDFGDHAYAWGYRFEDADEADAYNMISAIDEADPRLAYSMDWGTYDFYFFYVDYPQKLMATEYRFKVNGVMADDEDEFTDYDLADGMIVKVSTNTNDVWSTPITAATVAEMPVFSAITHDNINYWVGSGENQVVMAVNWADTALAWGCRFSTATITVADVMDSIANADARFSYTMNGTYLGNIRFAISSTDTLGVTPGNWWESRHNGVMDAGMIQTLANNSHAVLYDMTGREVYHRNLTAGESEFTLPVVQMANGIYMLRISGSTVKIAVKH